MKMSLTVRDLVVPSEESGSLPFTMGIIKYKHTATTQPRPPTTQNGIPNPPAAYKADPMAGPGKKKYFCIE